MEWKLEGLDDIRPDRPWMNLEGQPGFAQRAKLVTDLAHLVLHFSCGSVTDLGCGDGSLLARLRLRPGVYAWGYELGSGDVAHALSRGLDVRQADIVAGDLEYGDLLIASEVLEHLADPAAFLKGLPDRLLIASSPSAETGDWHNPIHSWAWDLDGYRDLLEHSGWRVLYQADCDGGMNTFAGVTGPQRFQAIVGAR
jgi:trans-aconitate methyltransferase